MKQFWNEFYIKNGRFMSYYMAGGFVFWIAFLIILPQFFMFEQSFHYKLSPTEIGTDKDVYTLSQYEYIIFGAVDNKNGYNIIDLKVFQNTIIYSILITIMDLCICYPIAFIVAHVLRGGAKIRMIMALLIIPYWLNEILRAASFRIILADEGILNNFLIKLGILSEPYSFIYENYALFAGMGYAYILMMLFPIYNAIETLDKNQIEAARDLGCPWWRVHWRVIIPHTKPGIVSGCVVVFMLTASSLALPTILGGPKLLWYTQLIYQWFSDGNNWPRGSAYAFFLVIFCIVFVYIMLKIFRVKIAEVAK